MHWNNIKALVTRNKAKIMAGTSLACLSVGAMAQTAGSTAGGSGPDYGAAIDSFRGDLGAFFTANGGKLLGILLLVLLFGIVWKLLKRGAKSV